MWLKRIRFRLRSLLIAIAALAIVVACSSVIVRWRVAQYREHAGQVALSRFGGTYSMESALNTRKTGTAPNWTATTFTNHVAEVDLSIDAWPVQDARVSGKKFAELSDHDLHILGNFVHLQTLDLQGRGMTDESIGYIKRLRHLRKLNITGTQISEAGVSELRSAIPDCHIQR